MHLQKIRLLKAFPPYFPLIILRFNKKECRQCRYNSGTSQYKKCNLQIPPDQQGNEGRPQGDSHKSRAAEKRADGSPVFLLNPLCNKGVQTRERASDANTGNRKYCYDENKTLHKAYPGN